jgi:DNA-binding PadR family transcriptional regulator
LTVKPHERLTAMTSTLGYAILAILARHPRSGYELSTAMSHPLGYFWTARHSQIHPELQRLVAAGQVSFEQVPGPGPQDKKIYSLTDEGLTALRQWVVEPPQIRPERDEMVLKTYAAWLADPAELIRLFRDQLEAHKRRLSSYEEQRASMPEVPAHGSPAFGNYATLWCGISYENHRIAWCRWMIGQLGPDRAPLEKDDQLSASLYPSWDAVKPSES